MEAQASKKKNQRAALEKNGLKEGDTGDRISDLPIELLHHIFSSLPIESLAQTTVLSKHWKHLCLWRSHPHLNFIPLSPELLAKATKFVPDVLSRRHQGSNITTFRLFGQAGNFDQEMKKQTLLAWGVAILCFVVLMIIKPAIPSPKPIKISLTNANSLGLDLFSGTNFPVLRKLCLRYCNGMYGLKINCPGLEILELARIGHYDFFGLEWLDISCLGLLELQVIGCLRYYSTAKVFAPSLRRFDWVDGVDAICTMEKFEYLNTGSVFFGSGPTNENKLQTAATFLSALCFARSLSFGSAVLEMFSNVAAESGLPYSFSNLTTLELRTDLKKDQITVIVCFLISSPKLHTITIGVDCFKTENKIWDDGQYWRSQSQNLKSTTERHLKVARIDFGGARISKSAVCLVEFLLRCETALQEMTLTLKNIPANPPHTRESICSEIMKFAPASCIVKVSFLPQD